MKKNILIVTLNPAVDYLFWPKQNSYRISEGGKGRNVERALRLLKEVPEHLYLGQNTVRGNITVYSDDGDAQRFLELGTRPTALQKDRFKQKFRRLIKKAKIVLLCGSTPPKSQDFYPWMVRVARAEKISVWVDTSQPALGISIGAKPQLIKPNLHELEEYAKRPLKTQKAQIAAVQSILQRGVDTVVLTLGGSGAMLCKKDEIWYAKAPKIKNVSDLGCGDVFLASLCFSYLRKRPASKMLSRALALATANACTSIPGQFQKSHAFSLEKKIKIQKLL